jgi:RimJ/RimL family protein N-acetyltransferase
VGRPVSPELLGPDDYEALAEHLNRQNAETDKLGLPFFVAITGPAPDAYEPSQRANRLSNWARKVGDPGWQRMWGLRDRAGGMIIAHLELTGPEYKVKQHRAKIAIGVEPAFRRQGLGEGLLRAAIAFAHDVDLAWLDLWVFAHNEPATALYRKIGFVEVGRFKDQFRIGQWAIEDIAMAFKLESRS